MEMQKKVKYLKMQENGRITSRQKCIQILARTWGFRENNGHFFFTSWFSSRKPFFRLENGVTVFAFRFRSI